MVGKARLQFTAATPHGNYIMRSFLRFVTLITTLFPIVGHADPYSSLWGVYPATFDNKLDLYGIVRSVQTPPGWEDSYIEVMISATTSEATTDERRLSGNSPCGICTAKNYFKLHRPALPGHIQKLKFSVHTPGSATYLHINGKEYLLSSVHLTWTENGPHLKTATLWRTGFMPPLFKSRIKLSFQSPLVSDTESNNIIATALADSASTGF